MSAAFELPPVLALVIFIASAFMVAGIFGLLVKEGERRIGESARRVGGRLGGRFAEERGRRRVEFEADGVPARFSITSSGLRAWDNRVRVHVAWAPPATLRIATGARAELLRKTFGAEARPTGDAAFDRLFLVQGTAEGVLTDEFKKRYLDFCVGGARQGWGREVRLLAGPAGIALLCQGTAPAKGTDRLHAFVEAALAFARPLRGLGGGPPAAEFAGACPVCARAAEGAGVRCPRCAAAHHVLCWLAFGGCAVFACDRVEEGYGASSVGHPSAPKDQRPKSKD